MPFFACLHQWFNFDLSRVDRAGGGLWAMLGARSSKCGHIAGVPLRPDVALKLHRIYLAKGALATTAIEGNTLSEREVQQALEGSLKLPPSREYLRQEVDNIAWAFDEIFRQVGNRTLPPLSVHVCKDLNAKVLAALEVEEGVQPGEIRRYEVGVSRYRGAPHEDCEFLLQRLAEWLEGAAFMPQAGRGPGDGRWTVDAWAPLDGPVFNGGIRLRF